MKKGLYLLSYWYIPGRIHLTNARRHRRKRRPVSSADMFVSTSYIRLFPVSRGTAWHMYIRASLQLVSIWISVRCLILVKARRNPAISMTLCGFVDILVPKVPLISETVLFFLPPDSFPFIPVTHIVT